VITPDLLRVATGCSVAAADRFALPLSGACAFYGITTRDRLAAFLAQIGHESGGLRYVRELWGPTPVQERYEGRRDLGNTQPGDGRRYMGRGLIQTTGRYNYQRVRDRLRESFGDADVPDFEAEPDALEQPRWAVLSAADYWDDRGLNALADAGDFLTITKRINGRTNGLADRQQRWVRAKDALAGWAPVVADEVPDVAPDGPPDPAPEYGTPLREAPHYTIPAGEAGDWQPPEATMPIPAIVGALLPTLIESIPRLGKLFGSGSAVSERNVQAATIAMQIAQEAVGARNAQEAVETIKSDPAAAATAARAIEARWLELSESGGDGIAGARRSDAEAREKRDMLHSPSFWIGLLLLPLVYLFALSLIGLIGNATWSDDVRAGLTGSIVSAIIGGLVGYYFGQTTSRNRTGS
jgi:putative chitinase